MLIPFKSFEDIQSEMQMQLKASFGVTDFTPGSVASMLIDTYASREELLYDLINREIKCFHLSSADGTLVDLLGDLVDCKRGIGEADEDYRYRISKKVYTAANANEASIINAAKTIAGVKDVIINKYTKGTGSFTAFILTDELNPTQEFIDDVRTRIGKVKATGIDAVIDVPRIVPVDISFTVSYSKKLTNVDTIKKDLYEHFQGIFDKQEIGGSLVINDLIMKAQSVSGVTDIFLTNLEIDDETVMIKDVISFEWDERPYIKSININAI